MTNPFQQNPFGGSEPFVTHQPPQPPPTPSRDEANVLATLSVVFAFVFAPVGVILGHLGLSQIRRSGERGRDRALVGLTLSYVFITVAVVALIVGVTLAKDPGQPTAVPSATPVTSTSATSVITPPRPPMVTPSALAGLLPTLDDFKKFIGIQNLVALPPTFQPGPRSASRVDRPDCYPTMGGGGFNSYDMQPVIGYYAQIVDEPRDPQPLNEEGQSVLAFRDRDAAQRQLANSVSLWRQCGGSTMTVLPKSGTNEKPVLVTMSVPADAGNGITSMVLTAKGPVFRIRNDRAIAAKNNVLVDVNVGMVDTDRSQQAVLDITNYILNKIPR